MPVKVIPCDCMHTYQDKVYGWGLRVHNVAEKIGPSKSGDKGKGKSLRCTVCRKVKPVTEGKASEKLS